MLKVRQVFANEYRFIEQFIDPHRYLVLLPEGDYGASKGLDLCLAAGSQILGHQGLADGG